MASGEAQRRYEAEQAALRRKYDGGGSDDDDLHIEAPKAVAEVNPEIFKDVEPLLFRGFVYAAAEINGVNFVFKSLNRYELELLGLMGALRDAMTHKALQRHYNLFLAYGVLCVDGNNVLGAREEAFPDLVSFFEGLGEKARRKVIYHLSEINRRATRAVILTEAYCLEPMSRLRWAQYRGLDLMTPAVTGWAGTETLGMNWGQLTWRALNHLEDMREQAEREWENAKFVASAMAGKGMNRVHSQDKRRREKEKTDRQERRDRILRFALFNESPETGGPGKAAMKVARTVEELAEQLEKDLKGEKDWHDMVVDEYEQRVRTQRESRVQQIRQRFAEHQQEYGGRQVVGGTDFAGLSKEEVQYRISRRRQIAAQRLAQGHALPEHDPKVAAFLDKWMTVPSHPEGALNPTVQDKPRGLPIKRGDG